MPVPTPRTTRLVRVPHVRALRESLVELATAGPPLEARDRIVVVPTRAAAALLTRTIEDRVLGTRGAVVLPELVTPRELIGRLGERLLDRPTPLGAAEREVLLGVACRAARDQGTDPPFHLRPGLIAEILRFYDDLKRRQNRVDDFERRALGLLEPGAATDRGAERLVRQTRFLVAAFREFERQIARHGGDDHELRQRLIADTPSRPCRHVILAVGDEAVDPHGMCPADWDLLTRLPGLERLDVVVTDTMLAGAHHERLHRMLPGIEEVRRDPENQRELPTLAIPAGGGLVHAARDREEEVADAARRFKAAIREGRLISPGRAALVVRQRLPYVYVTREVLRSAGLPVQMLDALPLAAEPYVAALDLVLSCVSADFARAPGVALLRSPHFRLAPADDVAALDRALAEAGYLGGAEALERLLTVWSEAPSKMGQASDQPDQPVKSHVPLPPRMRRAHHAGTVLLGVARELAPLRTAAPMADHLRVLLAFLRAHDTPTDVDEPYRGRHSRARGAIVTMLATLRDAHDRFDQEPVDGDEAAALVRRWIEGQTFAPRTGDAGVHLVDADSAPFGDFDHVHIAGLIDGEWPDRPRRNIFYSTGVLRELGWPGEADRLAGARSAFADLLRLPSFRLSVSVFSLEADALVSPSALIDEVEHAAFDTAAEALPSSRIFDHEALCHEPLDVEPLGPLAREWAARRHQPAGLPPERFHGFTGVPPPRPYSLSALERYLDCPFKFFAADVLGLEELPEDESILSPRARGRFIHEVFQRFFEAWDRAGLGAITGDRLDEARALMRNVAEPLLARLPEADAALERTRLFGSAISTGSADIVLGYEASAHADVRERWLEYRLEGEFTLGMQDGRRVALRGVADRIDLLPDRRLRVVDYKSGSAPNAARKLQVAIYALCAQERLQARDGAPWTVDEAVYLAFSGKRTQTNVVKSGDDPDEALEAARARLLGVLDGIARGEFPPQPEDPMICEFCDYAAVCRKDYVNG